MLGLVLAAIEPTPGTLDVLEQVHGFYNDAWLRLMGVLTFVGVFVPVGIAILLLYWERRRDASFRLDTARVMKEVQDAKREMSEDLKATREDLVRKVEEGRKAFADDRDKAAERLNAFELRLWTVWGNVSWQIALDCHRRGYIGHALAFACESISADIKAGASGETAEVRLNWAITVSASGKAALVEAAKRQVRTTIDDLENSGKGGKYEECANALKRLLEKAPPPQDHEAEDEPEDDSSTA